MPTSPAWRKANPDWRKGRTPDQMKPWELKTIPEFYWDGEHSGASNIWFRCPHMLNFEQLNPLIYKVYSFDPVTIAQEITRSECGCHGKITDGVWQPGSGEHS